MEAGETIAGKYRVNRLLGTGGMASVWAATNIFTEREFAIKIMLPQVASTPEAARRFLIEAKVSARIDHPNIIDVIDVGQAEDGALFLVMELLNGMSLDVAVRRRQPPMTAYDLMVIMRDVASALAAAHRSGVVHRDLKPTNIFLHRDRDGRFVSKILDFGVSKILEEENNTALTIVGTVLGSPLYMSPEQARGATGIDGRTDVFAFGSMLFEALTGKRAYDAPNFNALIVCIATKQPRGIDEVAPHLPESLRSLVRDCLVTDKEKRLASFDLIGERIAQITPELEKSGLRLFPTRSDDLASDPDAADAQPPSSGRSDPPGAKARLSSSPPSAASAGHPSPLAMQISNRAPPAERRTHISFPLLRGTTETPGEAVSARTVAGAVLVVALVVGVAFAFPRIGQSPAAPPEPAAAASGAPGTPNAIVPDTAGAVAPPPETSAAGSASEVANEVPLVAVDSLPVAARRTAPKGTGLLSIGAGPGWCSISIDGVGRGVTPIATIALSPGAHRIDCVPPTGKPRTASVNVADGAVTRHKFALDE